jgi:hypothetical protein
MDTGEVPTPEQVSLVSKLGEAIRRYVAVLVFMDTRHNRILNNAMSASSIMNASRR